MCTVRLAPSLCISHSTKSDIHGIIIKPFGECENLLSGEIQLKKIHLSAPNSGKKVMQSSYLRQKDLKKV